MAPRFQETKEKSETPTRLCKKTSNDCASHVRRPHPQHRSQRPASSHASLLPCSPPAPGPRPPPARQWLAAGEVPPAAPRPQPFAASLSAPSPPLSSPVALPPTLLGFAAFYPSTPSNAQLPSLFAGPPCDPQFPAYGPWDLRCRRRRCHRLLCPTRRLPLSAVRPGTGGRSSAPAGSDLPARFSGAGVCAPPPRICPGAALEPQGRGERGLGPARERPLRCALVSAAAAAANLTFTEQVAAPLLPPRQFGPRCLSAAALAASGSACCPRANRLTLPLGCRLPPHQAPTGQGSSGCRAPRERFVLGCPKLILCALSALRTSTFRGPGQNTTTPRLAGNLGAGMFNMRALSIDSLFGALKN
ncbi:ESX-1 secretion-associated protein EspI-like [Pan troglodytes]|uniref:ESX-1 secretion-associated protein EspI-like n=1 Tax=Pan troglodytes TaxID=9598 RepID=UPI003013884B